MGIIYKSSPISLMEILCCTDSFEFKPHIHNKYVVWLNTGCGEHYTIKGSKGILGTGEVSVFEPGLVHSNHPTSAARRCLRSFYIDPEFFHNLSEQTGTKPQSNYFIRHCFKDPKFWGRLARVHNRMLKGSKDLSIDIEVLDAFSGFLIRHSDQNPKLKSDSCDKRVKKIINYYHAHYDADIRLQDLAQIAECTEFHLIRLFKQHTGLSPHVLLVQIRLENARHRLENGESIAQAAIGSGFSDQSHLTRKFKLRYGLTPRKYLTSRK